MEDLADDLQLGQSRPARGAWIEIKRPQKHPASMPGRAPHGARGLKWGQKKARPPKGSRAPHGARGLKF